MKKYLLILALAATLTNVPMWALAQANGDVTEEEIQPVTILVNGTRIHVANAAGQTLEVYDLAGVCVASLRIDSDDKTFNLNLTKGCYILKVGKVVRKVSIR